MSNYPPAHPELSYPSWVRELQHRFDQQLDQLVDEKTEQLLRYSPELAPLADALRSFIAGGKRLRPIFCYWGWRVGGGQDSAALMRAAASLEFIQAAALLHDDVMDASDTRRGKPAVHRRFEAMHRREGWVGSSAQFGTSAAIVLGDLCLSWADEFIFNSGLELDAVLAAKACYDDMRTEVNIGQYLDLLGQARGENSLERSMQIVHFKSAKYTVQRPLQLGAALATGLYQADGNGDAVQAALVRYGSSIGEAFQLRDDLLGVFGDPHITGKPAGGDLQEGKRTVLLAYATEAATELATSSQPADQTLVQDSSVLDLIGHTELSEAELQKATEVIDQLGARTRVEQLITKLTADALTAITFLPAESKNALTQLAELATQRSA